MRLSMQNYVPGNDYGEVYRLFTEEGTNSLIINKPDHNAMNSFSKWLDRKLDEGINDFKVYRDEGGAFVGFAYSYDYQAMDRHCVFSVAVKDQYQNIGIGGIIAISFLRFLFSHYDLRKVYIHVYGNNDMAQKCADQFGFVLEGTMTEYKYSNGSYVDLKIYSISHDAFMASKYVDYEV